MSQSNDKSAVNLVADIGGTNIRIAQTNSDNKLSNVFTYQCAKFSSLLEVLQLYINENQLLGRDIHACLAIACPTDDDLIVMTNLPWQFSQQSLKATLSLANLLCINDYTAIAMAIPFLSETQKVKVGAGTPDVLKPISVCGPGTGLGVATVLPIIRSSKRDGIEDSEVQWQCLNSEGGHMDFAPVDDSEIAILTYLKGVKARVSYEQLLSGYGLEQIYCALLANKCDNDVYDLSQHKESDEFLSAAQISERALSNTCDVCTLALQQFCKILGSFAGNLALHSSSLGGVYIAGGIVPRFIDFVMLSDFRARFEDKGRLSTLTKKIPTYIITESQPGLLGAAVYLNQQ